MYKRQIQAICALIQTQPRYLQLIAACTASEMPFHSLHSNGDGARHVMIDSNTNTKLHTQRISQPPLKRDTVSEICCKSGQMFQLQEWAHVPECIHAQCASDQRLHCPWMSCRRLRCPPLQASHCCGMEHALASEPRRCRSSPQSAWPALKQKRHYCVRKLVDRV